jgi:hypothetical protein
MLWHRRCRSVHVSHVPACTVPAGYTYAARLDHKTTKALNTAESARELAQAQTKACTMRHVVSDRSPEIYLNPDCHSRVKVLFAFKGDPDKLERLL